MITQISGYLMAVLYIFAGISHFTKESFFLKITPPYVPFPRLAVLLSGIVEIFLGITFLLPGLQNPAAWGIIVLLIVVFPVHVDMLQARYQRRRFLKIPLWTLWLRLFLQFVLIYWAYLFTR